MVGKKFTLEEIISLANKKHNFKYDYSLIEKYNNIKEKVPIICPKHGVFYRTFDSHIHNERGCPLCSSKPRYSGEIFVIRANEIHNNKYDYSKVPNFECGEMLGKDKKFKVEVICKKHGIFRTTIYNHLQGYGCPQCGLEQRSNKRKKQFSEFEKVARKVHGEKYKYIEETFDGMHKDMSIICPIHGEFAQKPIKHVYGHGCQKCKTSKLEEEMMIYLDKNNIEYKLQYSPDFLKNGKGKQSLDFYLPEYNIAIECQGIQHFSESIYSVFSDIEKNKKRDITKYNKCKENGINILYYTTKDNIKFAENVSIYSDKNIYCDINETIDRLREVL